MQVVALPSLWKVPAVHGSQLSWPVEGCLLPGLHGVGTLERAEHENPAGHVVHAVAPLPPWYLPAGHVSHCWLVGSDVNVPVPHGVGAVEPAKQ